MSIILKILLSVPSILYLIPLCYLFNLTQTNISLDALIVVGSLFYGFSLLVICIIWDGIYVSTILAAL